MTAAIEVPADDDGFDRFRTALADHVPGLPPSATRSFDVTRHGVLDHVQRVLVRSYVLDRGEHLTREAVPFV